MADFVFDPTTTPTYTGSRVNAGDGTEVRDEDAATFWSAYANENGGYGECQGGSTTASLLASFEFSQKRDLQRIVCKTRANAFTNSGSSMDKATYNIYVQVYREGAWATVAAFSHSSGGAGSADTTFEDDEVVDLTDVEQIKVYASITGHKQCCSDCGGSSGGTIYVYQLEAYGDVAGGYCQII